MFDDGFEPRAGLRASRILVTGATGFLGARIVQGLVMAGLTVFAAIRGEKNAWRLEKVNGKYKALFLDLTSGVDAMEDLLALHGIDFVINCAAYGVHYTQQDPERAHDVNVEGIDRLVRACGASGVRRLIHFGTGIEYGPTAERIREDTPLDPSGLYATTKAMGSSVALERARKQGVPLVVLRPFSIFGPWEDEGKLLPTLIRHCREGTRVALTPGYQQRDYLYVDDVVDACLRLLNLDDAPVDEVINLGAGRPVTVRDIARHVASVLQRSDDVFQWSALPYRPDETMHVEVDVDLARRVLGWRPGIPMEDGLRRMIGEMGEAERLLAQVSGFSA